MTGVQTCALPISVVVAAEPDAGISRLWWLIGAVVVLAAIYFMIRK